MQTIPGVARRTAEVLVAEIGTDLSRFPSAEHLASWAGMCPGNARERRSTPQWPDTPRQCLGAAHAG